MIFSAVDSVFSVTGLSVMKYFYPLITLGLAGFLILFLGTLRSNKKLYASIAFASLVLSVIFIFVTFNAGTVFYDYTLNKFSTFFAIVFIVSVMLVVFPALRGLEKKAEIFYAILLFVTVGMITAAFSYNLVVLFLSFEAVSIGTYMITAFRKNKRSLESSAKYFFMGVVSTSFIIFGLSYYFLSYGTFDLMAAETGALVTTPGALIAIAFLIIGFGFKLALFPMHQWALDTYDGTENSVSAFLATGSKLVAYLIILKLFLVGFSGMQTDVYYFFLILSILSMTYANIAALAQRSIKRILAYSSVAQAGYLILSVVVVSSSGPGTRATDYAITAGMYYSLVYIFMKAGSFLTMNVVKKESATLEDISGLAKVSPSTAMAFSIMLLALAGVPLTGGFLAKFYLFLSLFQANLWWLGIVAVINSSISVFYYFRIMIYMYAREPTGEGQFDLDPSTRAPVYFTAAVTVFLGLSIGLFTYVLLPIGPGLFG